MVIEIKGLGECFQPGGMLSGDQSEGHAGVQRGTASGIVFTKNSTGHIASRVKPGDDITPNIQNLRVLVGLQATHVVEHGREGLESVERCGLEGCHEERAAPFGVSASRGVFIPFGNGGFQALKRNTEVNGF